MEGEGCGTGASAEWVRRNPGAIEDPFLLRDYCTPVKSDEGGHGWGDSRVCRCNPTKEDAAARYMRNIEGEGREALVLLVLLYRVPDHRMEGPSVIVIDMPNV